MEKPQKHKMYWFQQFLAPPTFEGDAEKTHVAYLLNTILLGLLSMTVFLTLMVPFFHNWGAPLALLIVLSLRTGTLALARRGHVRRASLLLLTTVWGVCICLSALSGGVQSPFFITIISIILMAGLLTRGRIALTFALLSTLLSGAMVYANARSYLMLSLLQITEFTLWAVFSGNFIGAALLLYLATHARNEAQQRAQRSERQLAQKSAENQQLAQEATEASEFKSRVMGRISHELRTPLAAIRGLTEMLHYTIVGSLTPEQQEVTARIMEHTTHLEAIFTELLEQSRFISGQLHLALMMFSPQIIAEHVIETFLPIAQKKNITLTLQIADAFPRVLCGDPNKIKQILSSLVSNAIKFTDTGCVTLHLFTPDADHWAIAVIDTGIGIPADASEFIFEPFRQVDESAIRQYGGVGLGLALVQQLATRMQGHVSLESTVGEGSTFTVTMPYRSEDDC